jgi:hypothetical protein
MKKHVLIFVSVIAVLGSWLLAAGCSDDSPTAATDRQVHQQSGMAPSFLLTDMNLISTTYAETISPRDYLQSVSAWYFGHST